MAKKNEKQTPETSGQLELLFTALPDETKPSPAEPPAPPPTERCAPPAKPRAKKEPDSISVRVARHRAKARAGDRLPKEIEVTLAVNAALEKRAKAAGTSVRKLAGDILKAVVLPAP